MSLAGVSRAGSWIAAAIGVAAVLIVGAVRGQTQPASPPVAPLPTIGTAELFVGSGRCTTCHGAEASAWRGSQHARAMQPASEATVLGAFDGRSVEHFGSKARFLRQGDGFVVETEGRDGKTAPFKVDFTFGVEPLQQYLTTFPDGRVQALPYAWDTRPRESGGQRWFHLYPSEAVPPGDPLHWTGTLQNWNYMCADCHAVGVRKNYDPQANRFDTRMVEPGVGCESCHGPGASHVAWAEGARDPLAPRKGFTHALAARPPPDWAPDPATGSPKAGVGRPAGDEVQACGACHSRRGLLAEGFLPGDRLADHYRPVFLTPDLFEDDGQMKDEVFNLSSFQQSKMYAKGVVCSDCHEPHSGKLRAEGAQVCAQCHAPSRFAATAHTGHATGPGQPDCIACHMPARTYMVVDPRHDHSFRVPRPDLSVTLGTPNACNDCHRDKPPAWAATAVEQWHGPVRKGFQTWGPAFHAARVGAPEAREKLLGVWNDAAAPAIARATALLLLQGRPSSEVDGAMAKGLSDPDPVVRIAALGGLEGRQPDERWRLAHGLLADPVLAVRLEAVSTLADGPPPGASEAERKAFEAALAEFESSSRLNADRAESHSNLAHVLVRQRRLAEAEAEYNAAMALSGSVEPRVDLSDLYRATGREKDAELLLRQTIAIDPRAPAPRHALGLSLIRQKRYEEAWEPLRRAVELAPDQPRYAYVYAIALQSAGRQGEARDVLRRALESNPSDIAILTVLLQGALQARDAAGALPYAERLRLLLPEDASLPGLVQQLKAAAGTP